MHAIEGYHTQSSMQASTRRVSHCTHMMTVALYYECGSFDG